MKHKETNNNDNGRSVTSNGGGKDWSSDGAEAQMQGMREWKGRQHKREISMGSANFMPCWLQTAHVVLDLNVKRRGMELW